VTTPPPPEDGWPEQDAPTAVAPPSPIVPAPPPDDRRIGSGMLLAIGAIALVVLGFLITYLLMHRHHHRAQPTTVVLTTQPPTTTSNGLAGGGVAVPDVRHLTVANATSVLRSVGLEPRVSGGSSGTVASESPTQGARVAKGSEVLLVVKQTTTTIATTAQTTTAQTSTGETTTQQDTGTAPAPPQPTSATVPDLSGLDEQSAATALGKAGLLASLVFVPSHDELGTVEAQGKTAGTTVPYHSHVGLNVSTGPGNKPMETVPNVIGKTLQDALSAINGAQLRLIYLKYPVTSKSQAGNVVQQTPDGGAHAPQNAQVIVYLGAYQGG
jgi:beta-lactam-binding protein with PASTA domain